MRLGRNSRACNKFKTKQPFHLRLRTLRRGMKKNKETFAKARKDKAEFNIQVHLHIPTRYAYARICKFKYITKLFKVIIHFVNLTKIRY